MTTFTATTGYHNPLGENYELVSPYQNFVYEDGITNLEDLLEQVKQALESAKEIGKFHVLDMQVISQDEVILIDPILPLQIIPVIGDSLQTNVVANSITFKTLTNVPVLSGTVIKIVGMDDIRSVTLPYTDVDYGIRSAGNVQLRKFNVAEYFYLENTITKGWIRSAKSP